MGIKLSLVLILKALILNLSHDKTFSFQKRKKSQNLEKNFHSCIKHFCTRKAMSNRIKEDNRELQEFFFTYLLTVTAFRHI